ncbi:hypothetical protein WS72_11645 [Burkholderia savannae]|uniref:DUF4224 domain-containing protein n=1 Tax=Burkholderia savannae TaxID=1637837 RepID=A0ABR5TEM0_9BURK|nr:DUF4224 domain-containing protein [Burkholderia savannae]KWZ43447.1 hypothetical protein WS72_11645 [Burkholderia savannae]KWZ46468.1 hypothetical protein WS73_20770 [Burkholderia savannae]
MTARLMTPADLAIVTGKKRYTKQADWFKATFGIDVATAANGAVIMTWSTFESLQAKKAGLVGNPETSTVELCFD